MDAYVLTQADYDEIPELTDEMIERADLYVGDKLIRRGRPKSERPKQQVTIRLDADVLERLRETGPGWQTRINEALREWLERQPAPAPAP
ncbi:BrnA antitoxin family protein [Enterovirga sp. CN4-39]|uniref:BrnA antitoxin family protein n=1 Tax=Enterovirga sp. CN4-39 TaxID=3400910 RepID=UPI003C03A010